MTGTKTLRVILAVMLIFNIAAMTGCKEELPEYENIVKAIDSYHETYSAYRQVGDANMTDITNDQATRIDGTPCTSYYIRSGDGRFETVTLEYEKNDILTVDEYFYLSENAFYVVTSYLDTETMSPVITKYYNWKGTFYLLDEVSSSLVATDGAQTSGYYSSFPELAAAYSKQP